MDTSHIIQRPHVLYSCYLNISRVSEQYIRDTVFTYIVSGEITVNDGRQQYTLREGDFAIYLKNNLGKFTKKPSESTGEFKSLSVLLDDGLLKEASTNYEKRHADGKQSPTVMLLDANPLYVGFANSLKAYMEETVNPSEVLLKLKAKELLTILLETKPELSQVLFDFSEPGKIDLKAFMNSNFHFNVDLERFAYLSGRSLSTFKRDFLKIFGSTPGKWLQQKRLEEAYYQLSTGKIVSDVYMDVGFENFSHFSYAFKKSFGIPPSQLVLQH